jgi:hypothetical protein
MNQSKEERSDDIFPLVILNARPAAGKSEIIDYLIRCSDAERRERFHLGKLKVLDDFPMLWSWFEEDDILEKVFQKPRLHSTKDYYFIEQDSWHVLIRRLCFEFEKWARDIESGWTAIMEFSRGSQHGGYAGAYQHLSEHVVQQAASFYINVSFDESMRKNRRRYNPDRPDSILEHALEDEKMQYLYEHDDWASFTSGHPETIQLGRHAIPYVVFENETDITTAGGASLSNQIEDTFNRLWALWKKKQVAPV